MTALVYAEDAAIAALLAEAGPGWRGAARRPMRADASDRRYGALVRADGTQAVLALTPIRKDRQAWVNGRAATPLAFVALASWLTDAGLSAPRVRAADPNQGAAVLEHLGARSLSRLLAKASLARAQELLAPVIDAIIRIRRIGAPKVAYWGATPWALPSYSLADWLSECEGLLDALPRLGDHPFSDGSEAREAWRAHWQALYPLAQEPATSLVLRDLHAPNVMDLPQRRGAARAGLLDFQDAVRGPPVYDLASVLQDARLDLPDALEAWGLARYCAAFPQTARAERDAYAICAAQKAARVLGVFARLARAGRTHYERAHTPRVLRHFRANLAHPALAPVRAWLQTHAGWQL